MIKKIQVQKKTTERKINYWWKGTGLSWKNKKISVPWKFYKQSVQNIAYFNSGMTFSIRKRETIDKFNYYWLINLRNNKILTKRFFTYFWHVKIAKWAFKKSLGSLHFTLLWQGKKILFLDTFHFVFSKLSEWLLVS